MGKLQINCVLFGASKRITTPPRVQRVESNERVKRRVYLAGARSLTRSLAPIRSPRSRSAPPRASAVWVHLLIARGVLITHTVPK